MTPRPSQPPTLPAGTTLATLRLPILPPLRRPALATTQAHAVVLTPPLRRETAAERPAWRPGDVVLPALADDDGDLPTLATQLDHEPEVTP